jgi:hypothetical protein
MVFHAHFILSIKIKQLIICLSTFIEKIKKNEKYYSNKSRGKLYNKKTIIKI